MRIPINDIQGKTVVSEEGKMFGKVSDLTGDLATGELINIVVEPTKYMTSHYQDLVQDERNRVLVPFSAVTAVGDFIIIAEKEII